MLRKINPIIGLEGSILRYPFSPNWSVDSMQSQSKVHQAWQVDSNILHGGCKTKNLVALKQSWKNKVKRHTMWFKDLL